MGEKKTVLTTYFDDLDGKELAEGDIVKVQFGWSGTAYEIDLSQTNAAKIEKFIGPYVESARRVGSASRGRPKGSASGTRAPSGSGLSKEELAAAREWLTKNGHEVSNRGRIRSELLDLYQKAHESASS